MTGHQFIIDGVNQLVVDCKYKIEEIPFGMNEIYEIGSEYSAEATNAPNSEEITEERRREIELNECMIANK